jgi:hypothetical protein
VSTTNVCTERMAHISLQWRVYAAFNSHWLLHADKVLMQHYRTEIQCVGKHRCLDRHQLRCFQLTLALHDEKLLACHATHRGISLL